MEIPSIEELLNGKYEDLVRMDNIIERMEHDDSNIIENEELDEYCGNCGSFNMTNTLGHNTCIDCGNIESVLVDTGKNWRGLGVNDSGKTDPARCGMATNDLVPNASIGTVISSKTNESYGMKKMRQVQIWNSFSYSDSSIINACNIMKTIGSNSGISNCIIEEAENMYVMVKKDRSYKKTRKIALQAASLQYACKLKKVPRSTDEIAEMFGLTSKDLRKSSKIFHEIWTSLKLKEMDENEKNNIKMCDDENISFFEPSNSVNYIHRICSKMDIQEQLYEICSSVCEYVEKERILVKHVPMSITAGVIIYTTNLLNIDINKNKLKIICSSSDVTINKCCNRLDKFKTDIINNTLLSKYLL